ncbi:MAG: hypothetical protein DRG69_08490 [Deltaproteobacteria bacterium]|nr:MAG: hypothetical protein DRG69_08490 [Deltaproteobacteria bacterium]
MRTVAILTDFGTRDNYVGLIKGVILSITKNVNIVDITHEVSPASIEEGAFLLWKSYRYFPEGTVFLVVVDPGVGSKRRGICIKTKRYFFVGPDNGVLSIAAGEDGIRGIYSLEERRFFLKNISSTFHGRDIFAPVAAHISSGVEVYYLGPKITHLKKISLPSPSIRGNTLEGEVIYIDRFGNLVTNISPSLFESFLEGRKFQARIGKRTFVTLCRYYEQGGKTRPFFITGSFSFMEVSLRQGSASRYFKARRGSKVFVKRLTSNEYGRERKR